MQFTATTGATMQTAVYNVTVRLDAPMCERIDALAENRKRTRHWMIGEAVREYVEREEAREALRKAALESWQDYEETGLHVTGDEIIQWVESWGTENEREAPACHPIREKRLSGALSLRRASRTRGHRGDSPSTGK
jgi:predicted transcriptional regulator